MGFAEYVEVGRNVRNILARCFQRNNGDSLKFTDISQRDAVGLHQSTGRDFGFLQDSHEAFDVAVMIYGSACRLPGKSARESKNL